MRAKLITAAALIAVAVMAARGSLRHVSASTETSHGWTTYNGGADNSHFSPLTQINTANVSRLKEVWRFEAGKNGGLQTNPLIVGRMMYAYTSSLQVIALDAATGKKLWTFDSGLAGGQPSRGLTYWESGSERRLFAFAMSFVYALDPATGTLITSFGENGRIDLRKDLGEGDYTKRTVAATTPGVLYRDLMIVGFRTAEAKPAPRGDIRAYNVRTGKLAWTFHTIPRPGEPGYETWPKDAWKDAGAANNWSGMAVDYERGIVYAPTGSAVTDFYGADRLGDNLFANTLLALDANTGKLLWHFQDVHHDLWDRDFPSPPVLLRVKHEGKMVDAVAQPTKHGFLFVFDRVTGKPLFPITEKPFPASIVPGEVASPTQPTAAIPAPYARQLLTVDMLTQRTPAAHAWAVKEFAKLNGGGLFVPFALGKQTIVFPGFDGGAEWGGSATDGHGVLYVNANDLAWLGGLAENHSGRTPGETVYQTQCALCHGETRRGSPPAFPSLVGVDKRMTPEQITDVIHNGRGRMPGFPNVAGPQLASLHAYLRSSADDLTSHASVPLPVSGGTDVVGKRVYAARCALCHGADRMGAPSNYPSLIGVRSRYSDDQIFAILHEGKGRMPAVPALSEADRAGLLRFLGPPPMGEVKSAKQEMAAPAENELGAKYRFTGYAKFLDPDGYPAVAPPWGTLSAIDLNTGKFLWHVPLGQYPELAAAGMPDTGCENYGGPVVTAGGVVFIAATIYDRKIRAFDAATGRVLWSADLPFAGTATPATYMVDGKQYIVIATSGQRDAKGPKGAAYVAFALP